MRYIHAATFLTAAIAVSACSGLTVRQQDLDTWVGMPVKALDTHSLFLAIPMIRTKTGSGIEIRNYANGRNLGDCSGSGSANAAGSWVNANTFSNCSSSWVGCNNIFYIRDGKVIEYAPTGRCYTNETVQPQEGRGSWFFADGSPKHPMEEPVEARFLAWSRQWSIDNYIPLSVRIDETGISGKETLVRGTFRFERFGSIKKIPFSARLGTVPGGGFTVADLCYNDSSSGMTDCTNSSSGNGGLYKIMGAVLVVGVAAAILSAAGSGGSSSDEGEQSQLDRNIKESFDIEMEKKNRERCVEVGGSVC